MAGAGAISVAALPHAGWRASSACRCSGAAFGNALSASAGAGLRRHAGTAAPWALLECELLTGRTHQIRVHLAHGGHPILGDEKYGDFTLNKVLDEMGHNRMFLHAFHLEMKHPKKDEMLVLEAPMPAAFEAMLARFGVTADAVQDE